jgi:hypothetical protein
MPGGGITSGAPATMRMRHPELSMLRWWNQQSSTPLSV